MLEVKNIKINYGGIEAVRDISFQVPNGKIVTLSAPMAPVNPRRFVQSSDSSKHRRVLLPLMMLFLPVREPMKS